VIAVLVLMLFWLGRVLLTRWYVGQPAGAQSIQE
jgi:hypothetical protein